MACSHWLHREVSMAVASLTLGLAAPLTAQTLHATDEVQPTPAGTEIGAVPTEENAAEWLMAGGCAIDPTDYSRGAIGEASLQPFSEWSPELVDSVRESLDRQQAALEMLHRASTLDRSSYVFEYRRGLDAEMPDREVPDMLPLVKACRLLLAEARVAAADGDRQRALTALATMGRLASSLERESSMLTALIGIACERMMLAAAAETLVCGQPWTADPAFVEQLAESPLGRGSPGHDGPGARVFEHSRAGSGHRAIQRRRRVGEGRIRARPRHRPRAHRRTLRQRARVELQPTG